MRKNNELIKDNFRFPHISSRTMKFVTISIETTYITIMTITTPL